MQPKQSPTKSLLPFAIILVVMLVAGGAAWAMWHNRLEQSRPSSAAISATTGVGASSPSSPSSSASASAGATPPHAKGDLRAAVTLEEFADLQCPSCAVLHRDLQKTLPDYGSRVRLIFRHYPLVRMHQNAVAAALATEAAARQNKFWEMQDQLYRNQKAWSEAADPRQIFYDYARTIGLDADRFMQDMRDPAALQRVRADTMRGNALGITGTPTLYLNGRQLTTNESTESGLRAALDAALRSAEK